MTEKRSNTGVRWHKNGFLIMAGNTANKAGYI